MECMDPRTSTADTKLETAAKSPQCFSITIIYVSVFVHYSVDPFCAACAYGTHSEPHRIAVVPNKFGAARTKMLSKTKPAHGHDDNDDDDQIIILYENRQARKVRECAQVHMKREKRTLTNIDNLSMREYVGISSVLDSTNMLARI